MKHKQKIDDLISCINSIESVVETCSLPDLHLKRNMEVPSSFVSVTSDTIILSLASAALNDGMSLIKLPLDVNHYTIEFFEEFYGKLNKLSSNSKLKKNKYSLTRNELIDVLQNGAQAKTICDKYGTNKKDIAALENGGKSSIPVFMSDIKRLVPHFLLASRMFRSEMGLNFRGNHFLEAQFAQEVTPEGEKLGFKPDDVYLMTHLGPGPFSGNLIRHYSSRRNMPTHIKTMLFLSKIYFYGIQNIMKMQFKDMYKYLFPEIYEEFHCKEEAYKDLQKVIAMCDNFGYAYYTGTLAAIKDCFRETCREFAISNCEVETIVYRSHNSISFEDNGKSFYRHNAVRVIPNNYSLISGDSNSASCLYWCTGEGVDTLKSHDHGVGALLSRREATDKYTGNLSYKYNFIRGESLYSSKEVSRNIYPDLMKEMSEFYRKNQTLHDLVYLEPIATFKN